MAHSRVTVGIVLLAVLTGVVLLRSGAADSIPRTVALDGVPSAVVVARQTGRAFITTYDSNGQNGSVWVLDTRTGTLLRTVAMGSWPVAIAVDERAGHVLVAGNNTSIGVLDTRTGALLHTVLVGRGLDSVAVDARTGRTFVARSNPTGDCWSMGMLDMRTGRLLRTMFIGRFPLNIVVNAAVGRVLVTTSNDAGDGAVHIVDLMSGRLLRIVVVGAVSIGRDPGLMAVDARTKRLFVVSMGEDTVSVLDARSGALLHTVPVGQSPTAVAVDERTGRVFVVNSHTDPYRIPIERGSVSMLDARSGAALRTIPVGWDPTVAAVDERTGRIFVVNRNIDSRGRLIGNGSVSVLDARSGTVLRTIPVGVAPIDVAVDEQTGHAFVINAGGTVPVPDSWMWVPSRIRRWLPFLPPPGPRTRSMPGSVTVLDASR